MERCATMDLKNRAAIVTGGAGCLGRAISLCLRGEGCRVIVLDKDEDGLARLESETGIAGVAGDLADADAAERCVSQAWSRIGPVSILVNAVGLIHSAPLLNIAAATNRRHDLSAWRRVLDANLTSVFLATANTVERMVLSRTRGVVVNLSSVSAGGNSGQGAYSAAKAAVNAVTLAWAKELGPLGIRFVAIAPGFVDTQSTRAALDESIMRDWIGRTPLRRLGSEADVASAVRFAIANEYLTGKVIEIDGGLTL
jgi:3-oxoacyl-[acyl-carrier protein] reductase